jgi:hypothetical protein
MGVGKDRRVGQNGGGGAWRRCTSGTVRPKSKATGLGRPRNTARQGEAGPRTKNLLNCCLTGQLQSKQTAHHTPHPFPCPLPSFFFAKKTKPRRPKKHHTGQNVG